MANIKIGNLEIDNLKVGTLSVDALYIGDVKIYPSTPPPTPTVLPKYFEQKEINSGDTIPQGYIAGVCGIGDVYLMSDNLVLGDYPNGVCCEITTTDYFQGNIVRDSTETLKSTKPLLRAPQVDVYYNYKNSGGTLCEGINADEVKYSTLMPFTRKGCSGNIVSMYYEDGTHINNFPYAKYLCEIHPVDSASTKYNLFTYDDAINNSEKCYGIKIDLYQTYEDGYYFTVEGIGCYNENNEFIHVEGVYYITYYDGQWGVFSGASPSEDDFIGYIDDTTGVFNFDGDLGKFGGRIAEASEELLLETSGLYLLQEHIPTLQWVTFNSGDVIPSDLEIYGVSGNSHDLSNVFYFSNINFELSRNKVYCTIGGGCYQYTYGMDDNVQLVFNDIGCSPYYKVETDLTVYYSTVSLYIYA